MRRTPLATTPRRQLGRWLATKKRSRVRLPAVPLSGNDVGQVVHTRVPLSESSIVWYRGQGAVMPCGWEGNRRSGVALAGRHRLFRGPVFFCCRVRRGGVNWVSSEPGTRRRATSERPSCDQEVAGSIPGRALLRTDRRQVVHTRVPLSPGSILRQRRKSRGGNGRIRKRCGNTSVAGTSRAGMPR